MIDTLTDINRVIPAARIRGVVHQTKVTHRRKLVTLCGLDIRFQDLMVFCQRPEEITCQDCLEVRKHANYEPSNAVGLK